MSRMLWSLLLALLLMPLTTMPTLAQVGRAAIGGAVGVPGGAVVTMAVVVARARFQRQYLDSAEDLIHWQSVPMIAGPATGVVFGLAGKDALVGSIVGVTAGTVVGAAVGAGIGWIASPTPESPWSGGVIGAGIGLTLGGLLGGLRGWSRDEDPDIPFPDVLRLGFSVPVR